MTLSQPHLLLVLMPLVVWYALYTIEPMLIGTYTWTLLYPMNDCMLLTMLAMPFALRSFWPSLYIIGASLNRLVMYVNDGKTPVFGIPATPNHVAVNETHRLLWFADRFRLWGGEFNVGDVLIAAAWVGTFYVIVRRLISSPSSPSPAPPAPSD